MDHRWTTTRHRQTPADTADRTNQDATQAAIHLAAVGQHPNEMPKLPGKLAQGSLFSSSVDFVGSALVPLLGLRPPWAV